MNENASLATAPLRKGQAVSQRHQAGKSRQGALAHPPMLSEGAGVSVTGDMPSAPKLPPPPPPPMKEKAEPPAEEEAGADGGDMSS